MLVDVKIVISQDGSKKGHEGGFWKTGPLCVPDLGTCFMGVLT